MEFASIALVVVAAVTMIAAVTDLVAFKIYNVLTFPTLLAGLVAGAAFHGFGGFAYSLSGAMVGFAVLVFFCALGGVGPGDVKLFTAIGAWLGPMLTLEVFAAAAIAAGIYAVVLTLMRGGLTIVLTDLSMLSYQMATPSQWRRPRVKIDEEVGRADRRSRLVPFGAMTCVGFLTLVLLNLRSVI